MITRNLKKSVKFIIVLKSQDTIYGVGILKYTSLEIIYMYISQTTNTLPCDS